MSFLVGAVTGVAVMWIYGREVREFIDSKTQNVRERTADTLHSVAKTMDTVAKTVDEGLSGGGRRPEPTFESLDSRVRGEGESRPA